ncbi:MAG: glycosyltransferase family 4 protein [Paludibacteraceae bacterium]|nr:glycosyltransferase family 4 protein [Paludibacteraceae bacterium]MBQ6984017.1 glycosyltransferase family 4 protein [Paludibacteraceae bacterium]
MKVAYLFGSLNRGGAETLVLDVFKNASKASFEMIGIHRKGGAYQDEFYATGKKMIQCAPKRFCFVRYLLRLRRILLSEKVNIVHAQQSIDSVYTRLATIGTSIKIVTTFHGHSFAEAAWWFRKATYCANERILCVSEYQKRYFEQKWKLGGENKLEVVYNGIDFTKIDGVQCKVYGVKEGKSEEVRGKSGMKLAMVGNFVKGRSQIVVAQALNKLKIADCRLKIDFYFIGCRDDSEPERYDECVKYCEEKGLENVHFMGGRGDVPALLKQMDGFVYSTEHDTFGIAVIEAIAAGVPVVVNDWPVMKEVCGEENAGVRYFKTDDSDDAAAKIAALIVEIEESKKVAKGNAKIVRTKYSIEQHIENLEKIYKML